MFVGGQLALDMLFANKTLFDGKVSGMQIVGAICAVLFGWFAGLPIIDYFDPKKEEVCEEQFSIKIGRFGFSKSLCE